MKQNMMLKLNSVLYIGLLNARWSHLSLFQRINSVLMIESGSSKKVALYASFSNSFLKT